MKAHPARARRAAMTEAQCRQALAADPDHPEALMQLAACLADRERCAEAEPLLLRLLALQPDHKAALYRLGLCLHRGGGDPKRAGEALRRLLALEPDNLEALVVLGDVCRRVGDLDGLERCARRAYELAPGNPVTLNNLGLLHLLRGDFDAAAQALRKVRERLPGHPEVLANLIKAEYLRKDQRAALALMREAMALKEPGTAAINVFKYAKAWCQWGLEDRCRDRAVSMMLAGELDMGALLYVLASPDIGRETLFEMHRTAGRLLDGLRTAPPFEHDAARTAAKARLRIGYISGDFRVHAVHTFIRGILNSHDPDRFEVYCYFTGSKDAEDATTAQYEARADGFVRLFGLTPLACAQRIREDRIDLLVDLATYTENTRVAALAYRPAPVQIAYLGYPYTSGLEAMDYIVTDPYLDGPENARYFTERQLRLPESWITFDSLHEQQIDPVIPYDRNGHVTFGTLNNIYKLNREVVAVWSRILHAAEGSRLVINSPHADFEAARESILAEFARHGIARGRIDIIWEKHPGGSHLRYYNDIDIALDPFPLTGGTTTIDAVWMGVPVVTRVGGIVPERLSYSILSNVGLDLGDLVAFTTEEYVAKALALAANPRRIRDLRRLMPQALKRSILCDPVRLTRHLEAAYVEAWNRKYPDHPVTLPPRDEKVEYLPAACGTEIATDGGLDDLVVYVLREQGGWIDPEYGFVLGWLRAGMQALDVNAGPGVYAIPMAKRAGRVVATAAMPREARYLERGKARNGLANLEVLIRGDRTLRLDDEMARHDWERFDFVRLNLQPGETSVLRDAERFFARFSPLVMFNVKHGQGGVDTGLAEPFRRWGYAIYRYVPGLDLLAPLAADDELDAFALNLFALKPERARELAEAGRLVPAIEPLEVFPGVEAADWVDHLGTLPYARPHLVRWSDGIRRQPDWEVYWSALNLYARARQGALRPAQRLACLNASLGILTMLAGSNPGLPGLISLVRVLAEAGKREQAAGVLGQLIGALGEAGMEMGDLPFLAPGPGAEGVDPGERFGEWLAVSLLEAFERLRMFSSYFAGAEAILHLAAFAGSDFAGGDMRRRLALLRERFPADAGQTAE